MLQVDDHLAITFSSWWAPDSLVLQVDHLAEVKELAEDGDWAIRIPTTVVIELEVAFDDHNNAYDDVDEILYNDHHGYLSVLPK